jgi:hypothetical protein
MAEIMQIQCYKCHTVYEVQPEMAGQLVECAICSMIFAVPAPLPEREGEMLATYPYVELPDAADNSPSAQDTSVDISEVPPEAPPELPDHPPLDTSFDLPPAVPESTSTIKLTRSSIGMMPKVEDAFNFGTVEQKIPKNSFAEPGNTRGLDSGFFKKTAPAVIPAPAPEKNKWWQFWKFFPR